MGDDFLLFVIRLLASNVSFELDKMKRLGTCSVRHADYVPYMLFVYFVVQYLVSFSQQRL